MKVSFLAVEDNANRMTGWSHALNAATGGEIESRSICIRPNPFQYEILHDHDLEGASSVEKTEIRRWVQESDYIVLAPEAGLNMFGAFKVQKRFKRHLSLDVLRDTQAALHHRVVAYFGGSAYRRAADRTNQIFLRRRLFPWRIYALDLYRLGPRATEDLCFPAAFETDRSIDADSFIREKFQQNRLCIIHIPSNRTKKGSDQIEKIVSEIIQKPGIRDRWEFIILSGLTNREVLERMRRSHVYIDQFNLAIGGFGKASIEAMSAGNVVFAQISNVIPFAVELANRHCPMAGLPIIPTGTNSEAFGAVLSDWLRQSADALCEQALTSRRYVASNMNLETVARKFRKEIFDAPTKG